MFSACNNVQMLERVLTCEVLREHSFHGHFDDFSRIVLHHFIHALGAKVTQVTRVTVVNFRHPGTSASLPAQAFRATVQGPKSSV